MSTEQEQKEERLSPEQQQQPVEPSHAPTFTAVNGRVPSPPQQPPNIVSSPEDTEQKSNGIHHRSMSASQTTSPSIVESNTRNDTPNSINSPPVRKRSYPEAFPESDYRPRLPDTQVNPEPRPERPVEYRRHDERSEEYRSRNERSEEYRPHNERPEGPQDQDRRPLASDYDPHAQVSQSYYASKTQGPEDQDHRVAEAPPREGEDQRRSSYASPEGPERQHFRDYDPNSAVQVDADRKRRKRVFSNRTKTGCMTCRKRKKKCDELHPECNNCLRGGFVCEGYTVRNTWQKPSPAKNPVPLQSKTGPYSNGTLPPAPRYAEPNGEYGATKPELKPMDDGRRELSRISPPPDHRSQQQWPNAPRYSSVQQAAPPKYHERPHSVHEIPHELPDPSAIYPPTSAHPTHHGHQHQGPPPHQAHPHQHGPPPPPRASSSHQHSSLTPTHQSPQQQQLTKRRPTDMTERDKMLRGEYYLPYTPALIADREQCALAVWRFNNSTNPSTGIAPEDRMRFFKQILSLRPTADPTAPPPTPHDLPPDSQYVPNGSAGTGVIVEAPFHCDYGYNITIGSDVVIGADCRITDTCSVSIGNNVVFSPGVKLVCATYAIDPRERRKGKGRALGRNIVVEDDAWIGSNVTILPGVRVGRCSTVGAGSLLHKDVPPFTVVAGNPPKVVRGIYDDGRA